jgi:hypothetical protein
MVDIQTVSIAIASAGVLVAAVYYVLQIRHQTKLRQTDLIMRLHSYTCSKEAMEAFQKMMSIEFDDYDDFVKKYGSRTAATPETTPVLMIGQFMEGIGVLLHKELIDVETIRELFPVQTAWRKLQPLVIGIRKKEGYLAYEWFEYAYNEVKKREQKLKQAGVMNG